MRSRSQQVCRVMQQSPARIDGWKAIAAHFGRDRTTVMRWARDRDLPIRRVPGGGTASVYAYGDDLDRWLARATLPADAPPDPVDDAASPAPEPTPEPVLPVGHHRAWVRPAMIGAAALALGAAVAAPAVWPTTGPAPAPIARPLPADAQVAALYLRARDDWASRTPAGLQRAVAEFGAVATRDPGFAPAYAGLADTYLLIREFGNMPEAKAYAAAEANARAALAIDAGNADAHRALGFVETYWHRDVAAARRAFGRALELDPDNPQTHFWYGNALVDTGDYAAGLHELDRARLLAPGSPAVLADYAWALWSSGAHAAGVEQLEQLAHADPASPSPHTYLALIHFADGDYRGYLDENDARARRLASPAMLHDVAAARAAYMHGGVPALLDTLLAQAETAPQPDGWWVSIVAARRGDRGRLLAVLRAAAARGEHWGASGLSREVFASWSGDAEVTRLVAARRSESLLPVAPAAS